MVVRKDDLVDAMFKANLVLPGRTDYAFYVDFDKLSKHELCKVFIDDLVETFCMFQAQHPKKLGLVFNTHISKDIVRSISVKTGAEYGKFNRDTGDLWGCGDRADYMFVGYCIASGSSIHDAAKIINQINKDSRIVCGMYFFDRDRWQETLHGLDIDIYSTLNWKDLARGSQFSGK